MKNHKLYKAITEIKDDYILESKPQKNTFYQMPGSSKRTQILKRAVAVAAVFAVLLLGIGMANPTWAQKYRSLEKSYNTLEMMFRKIHRFPTHQPKIRNLSSHLHQIRKKRHNPLPKISHKKRIPQKTKTQRPVQIRRL